MRRRYAAIALAMVFGLSFAAGCGTASGDSADESSADEVSTAEYEELAEEYSEVPDEAFEDIILYLTDGEIAADDVVYVADGVDITAAEYFYYLTFEEYLYIYEYYYTYYVEPDITEESSDGTTMADEIQEDTYLSAVYDAAAYAAALDAGTVLSDEYQEALDTYVSENTYSLGESMWESAVSEGTISEDDYSDEEKEAWIEENGNNQLILNMLYYSTTVEALESTTLKGYYAQQYKEDLYGEGGELAPTEEELEAFVEEYGDSDVTADSDEALELYMDEAFEEYADALAEDAEVEDTGVLDGFDVNEYFEALEAFREILEESLSDE